MTSEEAISIANARDVRVEFEIEDELYPESVELCHVEHLADVDMPGRIENRTAWIVQMECDWGYARVYVDNGTGEVLRVVHSS
ncbi:MAG: PepSY domain-containing protein [Planctomycetota bacterium]|jgi:hypothetical protein